MKGKFTVKFSDVEDVYEVENVLEFDGEHFGDLVFCSGKYEKQFDQDEFPDMVLETDDGSYKTGCRYEAEIDLIYPNKKYKPKK